jgi:hypothetical protein
LGSVEYLARVAHDIPHSQSHHTSQQHSQSQWCHQRQSYQYDQQRKPYHVIYQRTQRRYQVSHVRLRGMGLDLHRPEKAANHVPRM